jgi:hypothetical protein
VGFLWFREFYLETSRVIQVGIIFPSFQDSMPFFSYGPQNNFPLVLYATKWDEMGWDGMV